MKRPVGRPASGALSPSAGEKELKALERMYNELSTDFITNEDYDAMKAEIQRRMRKYAVTEEKECNTNTKKTGKRQKRSRNT